VVKVLADRVGRVLMFTRGAIPHVRESAEDAVHGFQLARRHLGIYAYRVGALRAWPTLPASALERAESLEQLRALEAGWTVVATAAVEPVPAGIDSPADLVRARLDYDANEL
jgi:3-deoxy-manno-octulosonate cytidylyltransferase (CMP-KDO synthetase)